jgi:hypothetical protein
MGLPHLRFTVSRLMIVVFILAINFAVFRVLRDANHDLGVVFVTLPMANILILSAPRAWRRNATRTYWIGFEVGGWLIGSVFWYWCRYGPYFFWFVHSTEDWLVASVPSWEFMFHRYDGWLYQLALSVAIYTPPQIICAYVIGKLTAKCYEVCWYVSKKAVTNQVSRLDN